jgi:hypothetical protein
MTLSIRAFTFHFIPLAALFATLAVAPATAQEQKAATGADAKSATVEYLFVQTAPRVSSEGDTLTLHDVNPVTVFFSDRPARIAGHGTTAEYVGNWTKGKDSFAADPPNAALAILGDDEEHIEEVVLTLQNPRLVDGNLIYQVAVLEGQLPASAGASSLFIDVIGMPLTPVSAAGTRRRVVRRNVRF